jgi:glyoxylase-like metal-dependent hydrolase (beta-lactamase superfamily II)
MRGSFGAMSHVGYELGIHEVAEGVYAYLQPHGGWGLSNAGLVVGDGTSLLVDTLFDRAHTERMLAAMRRANAAARRVDLVVNTHANGDHCWGNELVREARIIASEAAAREMREMDPGRLALLMTVASIGAIFEPMTPELGWLCRAAGLARAAALIEASPYVERAFGRFRFDGIELVPPSETFSGRATLEVGSRRVELLEVGPAHTRGDVMVFVPDAQVVFTGDLLFADAHPLLWAGPVSNWIRACDIILERDVQVVVPGHGRLCGTNVVLATSEYLRWILEQSKKRYDAGLTFEQAALDLDLGPYAEWSHPERVAVNVASCYRELAGEEQSEDVVELFAAMARWQRGKPRLGGARQG